MLKQQSEQWRDRVPPGTFFGGDTVPPGTFHGPDTVPPGTFHGGDTVPAGTFHGGDTVPAGTFHGGDVVPRGTFHGGDTVPAGTFHSRSYYRTKDGQADYGFSFERTQAGNYRAYITSQPNGSNEHVNRDAAGRRFVCWDRPVRSEAEARGVAAAWADNTQRGW